MLAFPCNQFHNQESGTEAEIKNYVKVNYGVTFPMFEKIEVNGPNSHPVYAYLRTHCKELYDVKSGKSK